MAIQTKTIGIVGLKGGSGRSTLATTIAGELAKGGATVALIDGDAPQGTAASWASLRAALPERSAVAAYTAASHRDLVNVVGRHMGNFHYLVIDTPPRIAESTRAALALSDLVLVPCGASLPEIWASQDLVPLISEAKQLRALDARLVWSRFRAYTRLAQDLEGPGAKELGLKPLRTHMALRTAYAQALGEGLTAAEVGDPAARDEVETLIAEIRRILK
jgi:chromosome partitioning protein